MQAVKELNTSSFKACSSPAVSRLAIWLEISGQIARHNQKAPPRRGFLVCFWLFSNDRHPPRYSEKKEEKECPYAKGFGGTKGPENSNDAHMATLYLAIEVVNE
jgi:hypothetical protein